MVWDYFWTIFPQKKTERPGPTHPLPVNFFFKFFNFAKPLSVYILYVVCNVNHLYDLCPCARWLALPSPPLFPYLTRSFFICLQIFPICVLPYVVPCIFMSSLSFLHFRRPNHQSHYDKNSFYHGLWSRYLF